MIATSRSGRSWIGCGLASDRPTKPPSLLGRFEMRLHQHPPQKSGYAPQKVHGGARIAPFVRKGSRKRFNLRCYNVDFSFEEGTSGGDETIRTSGAV